MHYQLYWWKWIKNEWTCFEEFISDMYTSYKEHVEIHWENNTSIDRIDWNWDYNKNNCRRATYILQNNNKDNNVKYDIWWEQLTIPWIARKYNLNKNTLYTNARNGTILDKLSLIQQ